MEGRDDADGVREEGLKKCPKCDQYMELEEKDTSSGRDMRTYCCRACDKRVDVDNGIALWQVLHDARKKEGEEGN